MKLSAGSVYQRGFKMISINFRENIYFRITLMIAVSFLVLGLFPLNSQAYFNRGTVSVSLGQTSVSIYTGSSVSISVSVDPIKQDQLPGCGMAECPQTCGDGCLDENGECMCGGTEYKTYYSEIAVSSTDSSVASASYANGTLTVSGNSPGHADITVTGKLRQYMDSSVTLYVDVSDEPVSSYSEDSSVTDNSGPSGDSSSARTSSSVPSYTYESSEQTVNVSSNQKEHQGTVDNNDVNEEVHVEDAGTGTVNQSPDPDPVFGAAATGPGEDTTVYSMGTEQNESEGNPDSEPPDEFSSVGAVRDTARGKYRFVVLNESTDVPACFVASAEEKSHLVFQKKSGDNVDYSWTFDGQKLTPDDDYAGIRLAISQSPEVPSFLKDALKGKNVCYMDFSYSGKLPGTAEIYINVTDSFPEDQKLYLYRISHSNGKLRGVDDSVEMSNGYASFSIDHCSSYVLTDSQIKQADKSEMKNTGSDSGKEAGIPWGILFLLIFLVIVVIVLMILYFRHQKKR